MTRVHRYRHFRHHHHHGGRGIGVGIGLGIIGGLIAADAYRSAPGYAYDEDVYDGPPPEGQSYDPPFLVYDPLGRKVPLPRADARKAVRAILVHRYGWEADDPYVRRVVESFRDDPVRFREPRYERPETSPRAEPAKRPKLTGA